MGSRQSATITRCSARVADAIDFGPLPEMLITAVTTNGSVDSRPALRFEPPDLLRVMNQRPQRLHRRALRERAFHHLHRALHTETESVLVSQQNLHQTPLEFAIFD